MFTALIMIAIGIIIGWNLPQPPWARDAQARITTQVRRLLGGGGGPSGPPSGGPPSAPPSGPGAGS